MTEQIQFEIDGGVVSLRLVASETGNALSAPLLNALSAGLQRAATLDCQVITISAAGPAFCSGLDLAAAFADGRAIERDMLVLFLDCLTMICESPRPVLACVEGHVSGGGVGLVAACDLILASEQVTFMLPEVIVGLIPALITPFLLRRLSAAQVRYLTLSSRGISAPEAKSMGLVDEVAEGNMAALYERQLGRLLRSSPQALAESKAYFARLSGVNLARQKEMALEQMVAWLDQPDVVAGVRAFNQGDLPSWFHKRRK
ncbi:MAG: enoyl-CoA hydratase/isomerase family protein [Chloroflexi bacterium]|nr:enoyl-CoA hydratase/isomerase family protein [Chloroflexota bacterium]MCI0581193.1 enoyl-CoA hydratase/isomerase family protein [Chloroflexota bacterium]MCI0644117.1 enoyl-CoA hydratase/isomerase family protein [Chloroflexota bacterium]MCI0731738.1 enoyl-CoA hydratase/isomerase family protein [Chloroflexota bacterium]